MTTLQYALRASVAATALLGAAARMSASNIEISPPGRLRDPFRPVGYRSPLAPADAPAPTPPTPQPSPRFAPPPELWEEARRLMVVQGITSGGGRRMAMINNRVVSVGDTVELLYGGFLFRWIVDALDEHGVGLKRVEETDGPAPGPERPPAQPPPDKPNKQETAIQ